MTITEAVKEARKRDAEFWSNMSDLQDELLLLAFKFDYPEVRLAVELDKLIEDERKVSEVEL